MDQRLKTAGPEVLCLNKRTSSPLQGKRIPPIRTLDCEWGDYSLIGLFIGLYLKVLKITVGKRSEGKS